MEISWIEDFIALAETGNFSRAAELRAKTGCVAAVRDVKTSIVELKALAIEREKDVARLEGRLDQTTKVSIELTGAVKGAPASLDGLWRTLQTIHPDRVPKRASDRGG